MVAPPDQFHYNEWNDPFARCLSVDFYSLEIYLDDTLKVLEPYYPEDYEGYEEEPETWEQEEPEAEAAPEDKEVEVTTEPPASKKEPEAQSLPKVSTPPSTTAARGELSSGAPTVPISSPKLTRTESAPSVSREPDASPTASEQKRMKCMGGEKLQQLRAKIAELKLKKEKEAQKDAQKDQSMKKKEKSKSSPPAEEVVHRRSASPPAGVGQSEPAPKRHKGEGTAKRQRSNGENHSSIDNVHSKRSGRGEQNSSPKRSTSKRSSPKRQQASPKRPSPKRPRGEATLLPKRRVSEASSPTVEMHPAKGRQRIEAAVQREKEEQLVLKRHRSDVSMTKLPEEKRQQTNESPRVQLRAAANPRQEGTLATGGDLLRRVLRSRASPQDVVRNALAPSKSRRV